MDGPTPGLGCSLRQGSHGLIFFADGEGEEAGAPAKKGRGRVDWPVGRRKPRTVDPAKSLDELTAAVESDGGAVLGTYRDPFGGTPVLVVSLPIDKVEPTPYQRDPSETHIKKLMTVIEKVGRFLDPLVLIRQDDGYWTPNGNHRLQAMKKLGAKSIIGLLVPDPEVAFKILALNTEKAHNVKEKSLETIRMARALAARKEAKETDFSFEFEQAQFLTLGAAYEQTQEPERRRLHLGAAAHRRASSTSRWRRR